MIRVTEAKQGARRLPVNGPAPLRSSGSIDPGNVDARPKASGLPSDRGMRDQMRLVGMFNNAFKVIFRQGKGDELESILEQGIGYLNRLQSAARVLSNPKKYRGYNRDVYRQDAAENKGQLMELYSNIEGKLSKLIKQAVARVYLKASDEDKKKIATLKSFSDLPGDLQTIKQDEAELISEIFFPRGVKATTEEVDKKISTIVNSYVKLDKEVMDDADTVHNILTRLKTAAKSAKINPDITKKTPINRPEVLKSHLSSPVKDLATKIKKLNLSGPDGDYAAAKAALKSANRDDLLPILSNIQAGAATEADLLKAIYNKTVKESFNQFNITVKNILKNLRSDKL